jgi:hypothetical protein
MPNQIQLLSACIAAVFRFVRILATIIVDQFMLDSPVVCSWGVSSRKRSATTLDRLLFSIKEIFGVRSQLSLHLGVRHRGAPG